MHRIEFFCRRHRIEFFPRLLPVHVARIVDLGNKIHISRGIKILTGKKIRKIPKKSNLKFSETGQVVKIIETSKNHPKSTAGTIHSDEQN